MKLLKIAVLSEVLQSTDGRNYRKVQFSQLGDTVKRGGVEVELLSTAKAGTRVIWETGPNGSAGDTLYPQLKVGGLLAGSVETKTVAPYDIEVAGETRTVNSYSAVVFANEITSQVFIRANHPIVTETTETVTEEKPVDAPFVDEAAM